MTDSFNSENKDEDFLEGEMSNTDVQAEPTQSHLFFS